MRLTWDQLAKEIIPGVLEGIAHVDTSVPAVTDTQYVDLFVHPDTNVDWKAAFDRLGWLARMVQHGGIIEPYSKTIAPEDIRSCLRKQLALHHQLAKASERLDAAQQATVAACSESERPSPKLDEPPILWLLSPGTPRQAIRSFALEASDAWPPGFCFAAPGFRLCVVVLATLPRHRSTLPLRLLGRGRTLSRALHDVLALPETDPMRTPLIEVLVQRHLIALDFPLPAAEADMIREQFLKIKEQARLEGLLAGRQEGREAGLLAGRAEGREEGLRRLLRHQLEQRFGPLDASASERLQRATAAELDTFGDRVLTADTLDEVLS